MFLLYLAFLLQETSEQFTQPGHAGPDLVQGCVPGLQAGIQDPRRIGLSQGQPINHS